VSLVLGLAVRYNSHQQKGTSVKKQIAALGFFSVIAGAPVVPASPVLELNPTNQTVMAGLPSKMSVEAIGSLPLTYQWTLTRETATSRTTVNVPNATNAILVLSNTLPASAGLYSVVVTDASGSVTSDYAHLRVVSLELQPNNQLRFNVFNNVFGTAVRIEMTTNLVRTLSTFTVSDGLSGYIITSRNLPYLFFHPRPVPGP
jgi:hypothetical protein